MEPITTFRFGGDYTPLAHHLTFGEPGSLGRQLNTKKVVFKAPGARSRHAAKNASPAGASLLGCDCSVKSAATNRTAESSKNSML